jgi:hypothetical protein
MALEIHATMKQNTCNKNYERRYLPVLFAGAGAGAGAGLPLPEFFVALEL